MTHFLKSLPTWGQLRRDHSSSAWVAALIANLTGYGGPLVIVIGAAQAGHLSAEQTTSMLCILSLTFGLASLLLSLWTRVPIITAWSTPGAAFLISALPHVTYAEAIAGFMVANGLILLVAATGLMDALMRRLPKSIAAALLAGILFRFGVQTFAGLGAHTALVLLMLAAYVVARRWFARYATLWVLVVGCGWVFGWQGASVPDLTLHLAALSWTAPEFTWHAVFNIGLPLALITLTGQQVTGIAVLRASGYEALRAPAKPLVGLTALLATLTAPWGNFGINLAAITAAICTEPSCHPNPERRYIAGLWYGVMNLGIAAFAGVLVVFFLGLPQALITILAGLALLGAILSNISQAFHADYSLAEREAALITFMVCASGVTVWQLGSAFWAIVLGCLVYAAYVWRMGVKTR